MYLTTSDGVRIAQDFYPVPNPKGWLLLAHMMPATKESWRDFAKEAEGRGYASIAIDLRGHGESDGGPMDYQKFSDADHQKSILDLEAVAKFLEKQGAPSEKITLIGASIGANLSLRYLAEHPEIKTGVLLSAGLNYRGIIAEPLVKKLLPGQSVIFFSSEDDDRSGGNNAEMNRRLLELAPAGVKKELVIFRAGGHGTDLLDQAKEKIFKYLQIASHAL